MPSVETNGRFCFIQLRIEGRLTNELVRHRCVLFAPETQMLWTFGCLLGLVCLPFVIGFVQGLVLALRPARGPLLRVVHFED